MKDNSKPDVFDLWIDINDRVWNGWSAFCFFPVKKQFFTSLCFGQISAWNRLVDQVLTFHFNTVIPSTENAILKNPLFEKIPAEAVVETLLKSAESGLPCHSEFDTLIYPWRDAEKHEAPIEEAEEVYHEVSKVA